MPAGEAMRLRKLDPPRELLRPLPLKNILQDRVDRHRTAGADDHRPRILSPPLPQHCQRRHSGCRSDRSVCTELCDRLHESMHRRIVDAMDDIEYRRVVSLCAPLDDMLRLLFEKPEREGGHRDAACCADRQRQKAMPPLYAFFLRRITNR